MFVLACRRLQRTENALATLGFFASAYVVIIVTFLSLLCKSLRDILLLLSADWQCFYLLWMR